MDLKTGKEVWNRPEVGFFHAGLLRTGDNRVLMLDDSGNLTLFEPNAEGFRELASTKKLCESTFVTPALSAGRLYLRDRQAVICVPLAPDAGTE